MIATLVIVSVSMLVLAAIAFWTARRGAAGTLPRNELIGIRTAATGASDAAWIAAHRAGAGDLGRMGVVGLVTAVLPWASLALPEAWRDAFVAVVVIAGSATVILFSIRAAIVGGRAAADAG